MGFELGGLLKAVTDPGSLVNDLAHQFLPKDLQFLGGVAGAFVDYEAGNPIGAMQEGMAALKDLSQNNLASKPAAGPTGAPTYTWKAEPPPPTFLATTAPPPAPGPASESRTGSGHFGGGAPAGAPPAAPETPPPRATVSPLLTLASTTARLGLVSEGVPSAATTTPTVIAGRAPPPTTASAWPGTPPASVWRGTPPPPSSASSPRPAANTTPTSPSLSPPASTAVTPASTASTQPPASAASTAPPSTASASTASASTASASTASASQSQPITDAAKAFLGQGNDALMNAVQNGNIPSAVSDSPAAMMALQSKMNHISEMNQLMTSMMQALHQMQMSIIQNVRV